MTPKNKLYQCFLAGKKLMREQLKIVTPYSSCKIIMKKVKLVKADIHCKNQINPCFPYVM